MVGERSESKWSGTESEGSVGDPEWSGGEPKQG